MPKQSALKLHVNFGSSESPEQRYSPTGRHSNSPFQQAPTSITQNLKTKSLKSPTPIMPGGHKRPADMEQNGEN